MELSLDELTRRYISGMLTFPAYGDTVYWEKEFQQHGKQYLKTPTYHPDLNFGYLRASNVKGGGGEVIFFEILGGTEHTSHRFGMDRVMPNGYIVFSMLVDYMLEYSGGYETMISEPELVDISGMDIPGKIMVIRGEESIVYVYNEEGMIEGVVENKEDTEVFIEVNSQTIETLYIAYGERHDVRFSIEDLDPSFQGRIRVGTDVVFNFNPIVTHLPRATNIRPL